MSFNEIKHRLETERRILVKPWCYKKLKGNRICCLQLFTVKERSILWLNRCMLQRKHSVGNELLYWSPSTQAEHLQSQALKKAAVPLKGNGTVRKLGSKDVFKCDNAFYLWEQYLCTAPVRGWWECYQPLILIHHCHWIRPSMITVHVLMSIPGITKCIFTQ